MPGKTNALLIWLGKHNTVPRHEFQIVGLQDIADRQPDKHVGTAQGISQAAVRLVRSQTGGEVSPTRAQVFSVSMEDDAFLIATEQMGHAGGKKHTAAGGARCAESIHHDMNLIDRFPDHDQCVG